MEQAQSETNIMNKNYIIFKQRLLAADPEYFVNYKHYPTFAKMVMARTIAWLLIRTSNNAFKTICNGVTEWSFLYVYEMLC